MDHVRQKSLARPDRQGYLGNTTPKAHDQLPELPAQTMRPRVACVVCVISRCSAGSASWTADVTATYTITTSNSTFDTVLAVYLGTALNNLKVTVTNDDVDFRTFTSVVQFRAYAGETFQIAVDGVNGAQGQVELHVVSGGPAMSAWNTTSARGVPIQSSDFRFPALPWRTRAGEPDIQLLHKPDLAQPALVFNQSTRDRTSNQLRARVLARQRSHLSSGSVFHTVDRLASSQRPGSNQRQPQVR